MHKHTTSEALYNIMLFIFRATAPACCTKLFICYCSDRFRPKVLAIFRELSVAREVYVSTYVLEVPHTIND